MIGIGSFLFGHTLIVIGTSFVWVANYLEVVAWSSLLMLCWVICEYTYRSLEKDGQLYPYIVREEMQSTVMNSLLTINVVSGSQ